MVGSACDLFELDSLGELKRAKKRHAGDPNLFIHDVSGIEGEVPAIVKSLRSDLLGRACHGTRELNLLVAFTTSWPS